MNVNVRNVGMDEVKRLISISNVVRIDGQDGKALNACLMLSRHHYVGLVGEKIACVWGLIPPSILSDQAYLWLYTTPLVDEHKFLFIRHSQRMMEEMLKQYSRIIGFANVGNDRAIRWIKWLGGVFSEAENGKMNFVITAEAREKRWQNRFR